MAKYIGTYATSGDVQTALDNQELSRPFIAYTTDNEKVIYGHNAVKAETGDIVVYSVADDLLHYIKQTDYNTTSYPAASYVPVGVVAMPQADDAILGPSGEITFMGLNFLDKKKPDTGNTNAERIEWGPSGDVPGLTNYGASGTAITDMNGKANTEIVLQYATAQTDWRTASAITWNNADGCYPLFECAWRYHTSGTIQGDWFVPACGELYFLQNNSEELTKLNAGFTTIGATNFIFGSQGRCTGPMVSTEQSSNYAWCFQSNSWAYGGKTGGNGYFTRPYCSKLMTRI